MSESFYEHAITKKVSRLNDTFAAVYQDVLTRVDSPEGNTNKSSAKKTSTKNTDSPKEGND